MISASDFSLTHFSTLDGVFKKYFLYDSLKEYRRKGTVSEELKRSSDSAGFPILTQRTVQIEGDTQS